MKISEKWLRQWVNPGLDSRRLAERLTMAGLEVGAIEAVAPALVRVVVGEIVSVTPHPSADRLVVCVAALGGRSSCTIVSGAANAVVGHKVPVALPGAKLANGITIAETNIRGVTSQGMLCSATDLGLGESPEGLLVLEASAKPGMRLDRLFDSDDQTLEIDLTPNRGDCLSIIGIAREVVALTGKKIKPPPMRRAAPKSRRQIKILLEAPQACPLYAGRVVENINAQAITPLWMRERLRRAGVRCVHPVVDVTNYVQLELGQPMHAFDFDKLSGAVRVRMARKGESLILLDGSEVNLAQDTLLISDDRRPLAIAGILGGRDSAVDATTVSVFLESAHFRPESVAGRARALGLQTESAQRFERGADPALPRIALERATVLLQSITGGSPGPIVEKKSKRHFPKATSITLRRYRLRRLLGVSVPTTQVGKILTRLGMKTTHTTAGWRVTPPSYRFDITGEVDVIEELARVYGYDKITPTRPRIQMRTAPLPETRIPATRLRAALVDRDYQEVITYSFVDPDLLKLLDPTSSPLVLANPIATTQSAMRTSLWPGLLQTMLYNRNRQVERQRLFEIGRRFIPLGDGVSQEYAISGAVTGTASAPQWGMSRREGDFFDAKADVEALLALTGLSEDYRFRPAIHPALHPGIAAEILFRGERVGWLGELHPGIQGKLGLDRPVFLFEVACAVFDNAKLPGYREISRFPAIRRDIAVSVEAAMPAEKVLGCVKNAAGDMLVNLELFDEYHGKGVDSGRKSFAMGLTLQTSSRTLNDSEVDALVSRVIIALETECRAKLRQ